VNLGQRLGRMVDNTLSWILGGLFLVWALAYLLARDTWEKLKVGWKHLVDVGNPDSALNAPKAQPKAFYLDLSPSPLVKKPRKKKTPKAAPVAQAVQKSEEVTKRITLPSKVALTIPPPPPVSKKTKKPGRPKKTKTV